MLGRAASLLLYLCNILLIKPASGLFDASVTPREMLMSQKEGPTAGANSRGVDTTQLVVTTEGGNTFHIMDGHGSIWVPNRGMCSLPDGPGCLAIRASFKDLQRRRFPAMRHERHNVSPLDISEVVS